MLSLKDVGNRGLLTQLEEKASGGKTESFQAPASHRQSMTAPKPLKEALVAIVTTGLDLPNKQGTRPFMEAA